jgi:Domain of unknown function (DUF4180)
MRLELVQLDGVRIVVCADSIDRVDDVLDVIASCVEHRSGRLLLESRQLPPTFFDLRTGFAGEFVQKLVNYQIRFAGVFPSEEGYTDRFREFLREASRGRSFRAFANRADAEAWLAGE